VSQWIGPRQFLRLTFATFATILVVSFVLFAVEPGLVGSDRWGGGWLTNQEFSGIMASKNYAGFVFAALYVMSINGGSIGLGLPTRIVFAAAALVAVVLTNSATALVVVVIATVASVVLAFAGRLRWALVFLGLVATTAAVVLIPFISPGEGFDALGRDASFTGRADLWASAFKSIVEHPILGVGYNGFFDVGAFSPAWEMWSHFLYYFADNFHNSAVEMAVSLGVAGLAAFVAITLRACWIVFSDRCDGAVAVAAGLVLGVFIAGSAMEFAIMHHNFVATFLVFYFFFSASPQRG
jgi:O-antigen ligase